MKSAEKFYVSFEGKTIASKGPFLVYRDGCRFALLEKPEEAESIARLGNSRNALAAALARILKDAERIEVGAYLDGDALKAARAALQMAAK